MNFDALIQAQQQPNQGVYNYSLRFQLAQGVTISDLKIITDVMAHPLSLPRLSLGENTFEYTDESDSRDILIEHHYQESSAVTPLTPPAAPTFPLVRHH